MAGKRRDRSSDRRKSSPPSRATPCRNLGTDLLHDNKKRKRRMMKAQGERFLAEWFSKCPTTDWITLNTKNHTQRGLITRWYQNTPNGHSEATRWAQTQQDVWVGVSTRNERLGSSKRGGLSNCAHIPGVWADIDIADPEAHQNTDNLPIDMAAALDLLARYPLKPTFLIDSGHGLHAYWKLDTPETRDTLLAGFGEFWRETSRLTGLKVDAVQDAPRILRLPGTLNHKTAAKRPCRIIEATGQEWTHRQIADAIGDLATGTPKPQPVLDTHQPTNINSLRLDPRPGDQYNAEATIPELLAQSGWSHSHLDASGNSHWVRPGKNVKDGTSAVHYRDIDRLHVFTDASTLPHGATLDPFGLYTHLNHGGNFSGAAQALKPAATHAPTTAALNGTKPAAEGEGDKEPAEPTSWAAQDITKALTEPPKQPEYLTLNNNESILYPAATHIIYAPSEHGKSWVTQITATQALEADRKVAYIDFEDTAQGVGQRLKALGTPTETLTDTTRFRYIRPFEPLQTKHGAWTLAALDLQALIDWTPHLVILDGVTEAMAIEALSPNDAADVAAWFTLLPSRLAALGACVVMIDHTAKKQGEDNTPTELGSQHKRAAVTGASILCEAIKRPGRATGIEPIEGLIRLQLAKDRPGYLRGRYPGEMPALADITLTSWPDNTITYHVEPSIGAGRSVKTPLMHEIVEYLTLYGADSRSQIAIGLGKDRTDKTVGGVLSEMLKARHVAHEAGPRNSRIFRLTEEGKEAFRNTIRETQNSGKEAN